MTKKLILLSTALLTCLFFFFSCNKESQTNKLIETDKNSFSVSEAKSWYVNNSSQQPNSPMAKTNAKKINNFYPQWDRAITANDKNYEIVECPLKFDTHPGFIISTNGNSNNNNNVHGITRLLILKNKKNGSIRSALMNIYSASGEDDSTITYSNKGKHFSGYVFFTDISGEFINGWLYNDGIITKQSKRELSSTNSAARAMPPAEDCETFETMWYEQDCNYYTDGSFECTDWYYIGSTYETYCTEEGGGGGGGVNDNDTDECVNNELDVFTQNIDNVTTASVEQGSNISDIDGFTKHKDPKWLCLNGPFFQLESQEIGVIKLIDPAANTWAWRSLTHGSISIIGISPPFTHVEFSQGVGTPSFTDGDGAQYNNIFYAGMSLNFNVTYNFVCDCPFIPLIGQVPSINKAYTSNHLWNAQPF